MAAVKTLILTINAGRNYSQDVDDKGTLLNTYSLNSGLTIQLAEYTSIKEVEINNTNYNLSIQDLSFKKKMYEAGEITAVIHFGPKAGNQWEKIDKSTLEKLLKKMKVTLSWGTIDDKNTISTTGIICQGYYVHEVRPQYMSDGMNVTLIIYSPDKVMTIGKHCNSWTSTQLAATVFKNQLAKFKAPYLKTSPKNTITDIKEAEDERDAITGDIANLAHLKNSSGREAIIPYLVQYNESFWDFLVRSTNRWGEFLYYEDSSLHIGFESPSEDDTKTIRIKSDSTESDYKYDAITYCDLNESPVADEDDGEVCDSVSYDANMDRTFLEKSKYAEIKGTVYSWGNSYDTWASRAIGRLFCSGKNVYDFFLDMLIDDSIAHSQAKKKVDEDNDAFDKKYFKDSSSSDTVKKAHYNSDYYNEFGAAITNTSDQKTKDESMATYMPFAATNFDYVPDITPTIYKEVRNCEEKAAQNAVCIDFSTDFANLTLGQVIKIDGGSTKYIVTQVNNKTVTGTITDVNGDKVKDANGNIMIGKYSVFEVYAIAETGKDSNNNSIFFPTPSPAGHIRLSAPQLAIVCDADDPLRQGRVKVRYEWQKANKGNGMAPKIGSDGKVSDSSTEVGSTPWLVYAQPGGNKGTGSFYRHYPGELVLVNFADGNVERPYVVGALYTADQTMPGSINTNNIVHVTPGGQAIKMSDGTGAGATAFVAALMPGFKMVQGFYPGVITDELNTKDTLSFDGGIELCDKFGMYSIKSSTSERNITIKSPFGDVKLNAFTGITISAPNGDIKIQGKNVSIEAGNNLTLTSGKNIKDGFWCSYHDKTFNKGQEFGLTLGAMLTKKLASMVGGFIDFSIIRNVVEIFMKPVEGKLTVKSNRYLALEAGTGKTSYPMDAFQLKDNTKLVYDTRTYDKKRKKQERDSTIRDQFTKVSPLATAVIDSFCTSYNTAYRMSGSVKRFITTFTKPSNGADGTPSCKTFKQVLDAIWANPDIAIDAAFMEFKELLGANNFDEMDESMREKFKGSHNSEAQWTEQQKTATYYAYNKAKETGIKAVTKLRNAIKPLANFEIGSSVTAQRFNAGVAGVLDDTLLQDSMTKKCKDANTDIKYFKLDNLNAIRAAEEKALKRTIFIKLVNILRIEREKMGGINGVGAKVPDEPQPFANDDEVAWNNYVNSIQSLPPIKYDYTAGDFFQKYLGDPLAKQFGLADLAIDAADNCAFGSNSKGKILFTSDKTTMELGKEIIRANTDSAEDYEYDEGHGVNGFVTAIRAAMNS